MIVASLLLILVAVLLLVLGLVGGSSALLISSIVASLLAAVALVIGARQASGRPAVARRSTLGDPLSAEDTEPALAEPAYAASAPGSSAPGSSASGSPPSRQSASDRSVSDEFAPDESAADRTAAYPAAGGPTAGGPTAGGPTAGGSAAGRAASGSGSRWGRRQRSASVDADADAPTGIIPGIDDFPPPPERVGQPSIPDPDAAPSKDPGRDDAGSVGAGSVGASSVGAGSAGAGSVDAEDSGPERAAAYAAGQRDAEASLSDPSHPAAEPSYRATGSDVGTGGFTERVDPGATLHDESTAGETGADRIPYSGTEASRPGRRAADYDQAASVIGGARAQDDESWRRDEPGAEAGSASAADPLGDDRLGDDRLGDDRLGDDPLAGGPLAKDEVASLPTRDESVVADDARRVEYGDPDPEDPDDEPLPQAVRPTDAVRVARMEAGVVVVDGRPRYHLAACPFVAGKHTEALPVSEAVELGFSPCGTCRPVDNLVAAASRY